MIPLRDSVRARRFPLVTLALIVVNVAVFAHQVLLGTESDAFLLANAVVPARLLGAVGGPGVSAADASALGESLTALASRAPPRELATVLSSMFLHGGILHLLGNMWFLWVFGDNVEDRFGRLGYLAFYGVCGVVAAVSEVVAAPGSAVPMIGASGAVAGVLGAYLRLYPGARVLTVVPIFIFLHMTELPAVLFLGLWFAVQIWSSWIGVSGVAWWAHIAGFVAGLLLSFLAAGAPLPRPRRATPRRRG
jgi:membrane associated rhomboid family serine protease